MTITMWYMRQQKTVIDFKDFESNLLRTLDSELKKL